jgi:hypothetical protein
MPPIRDSCTELGKFLQKHLLTISGCAPCWTLSLH